jgi:hypothetical protein
MELKGFVHYDCATDTFDVSAWLEDSGAILKVGLSTMTAQLYDKDGSSLSFTESGITPDALGLFSFTEVVNPDFIENGKTYLLRLETTYAATEVSTFLPFRITNI